MMSKSKKLALSAVLTALALALSYAERAIPLQLVIPLPGIKLGLANTVTMVALYLLGTGPAYGVLVCRCFLGALFGGGITGFSFSLLGGVLALAVMTGAKKSGRFSVYGVSVLGAAAHNMGQILAATVLMQSLYVGAYLPWLLLVAIVTGLLTGGCCGRILRTLGTIPSIPSPSGDDRIG